MGLEPIVLVSPDNLDHNGSELRLVRQPTPSRLQSGRDAAPSCSCALISGRTEHQRAGPTSATETITSPTVAHLRNCNYSAKGGPTSATISPTATITQTSMMQPPQLYQQTTQGGMTSGTHLPMQPHANVVGIQWPPALWQAQTLMMQPVPINLQQPPVGWPGMAHVVNSPLYHECLCRLLLYSKRARLGH
jgi:hypothetical protein